MRHSDGTSDIVTLETLCQTHSSLINVTPNLLFILIDLKILYVTAEMFCFEYFKLQCYFKRSKST